MNEKLNQLKPDQSLEDQVLFISYAELRTWKGVSFR